MGQRSIRLQVILQLKGDKSLTVSEVWAEKTDVDSDKLMHESAKEEEERRNVIQNQNNELIFI